MANNKAVWGIDIGQCGLKALRCNVSGDGDSVTAEAYDYIEYPKILSSPDADPEVLVAEALEQFLSRNELTGDAVAVAVPGQAGLSRFFKPPPVDAKTLPDIVKYEVKQQIPFPLEDVIWDWQRMGGTVVDDVTVDAEVGLFAMKRDAVFRALKPFTDSDIEVDFVQLAPLATFNVVCHDILEHIPDPAEIDMDNPPESLVVLSIGTDTTDLIITNGVKLWQRNIPIGGNHFTKQLARELKLTTNKAELLKRNARQAEDPKTVFQAMRSVFSDLVTEIQRSISYFQGMEKNAKIKRIALMGNAAKLPGLRQFLNKQLELDIVKVGSYRNLAGDAVVKQKSFEDNILTFAPCYGLCLQGLGKAQLKTNLLPQEFVQERLIRAKKPWTLAAVSTLMLGMTLCFLFFVLKWYPVQGEYKVNGKSWDQTTNKVTNKKSKSDKLKREDSELKEKLELVNRVSKELSGAQDNKTIWLELLSAVHQVLPRDPNITGSKVDAIEVPFENRKELYFDYMETEFFDDLTVWTELVEPYFEAQLKEMNVVARTEDDKKKPGPANKNKARPGFVVELGGYHFYNSEDVRRQGAGGLTFVRNNLIHKMLNDSIKLPGEGDTEFKFSDFGITLPTIVQSAPQSKETNIRVKDWGNGNDDKKDADKDGADQSKDDKSKDESEDKTDLTRQKVDKFDFVIQFSWEPRSRAEIKAARNKRIAAEKKAAEDADKKAKAAQNTKPRP